MEVSEKELERMAAGVPIIGGKKSQVPEKIDPMSAKEPIVGWLHAKSGYDKPLGNSDVVPTKAGLTNLDVLVDLIARNGVNAAVTGWGYFSGPLGLTQTDAFLLMQLGSYFQGMMDYAGVKSDEFINQYLMPKIIAKVEAWTAEAEADAVSAESSGVVSDPLARDADEDDGA